MKKKNQSTLGSLLEQDENCYEVVRRYVDVDSSKSMKQMDEINLLQRNAIMAYLLLTIGK